MRAMHPRKVAYATFEKWRRDFDRDLQTVSWLECKSAVENGVCQDCRDWYRWSFSQYS